MKKNILFFGIYPPPYGGISTLIMNLVSSLINERFKVHVFSPGYKREDLNVEGLTIHKPINNKLISFGFLCSPFLIKTYLLLRKHGVNNLGFKRIIKISSWLFYLKKQVLSTEKVDFICAFHLFDRGLAATILGHFYNIPVVVVNLGEIYTDRSFYEKNINALKFIIDNSKRIVSASKHCAESYKLLNLNPDVEIIYSGVDSSKFNPKTDGNIIRNKYDIDPKDFVIMFLGRMIYDMGLDHLIQAIPVILKENNSVHFLIGGAKGELTDQVYKLKNNYPNNISVGVNIPFNELPYYYASSDLVVVPTSDDRACMGLAIKEAMFSRKPVIGNKVGGIPEAIINTETGLLINTEDVEELSYAILKLEKDRDLLNKMGEAGYNRALELFSFNVTNKKYINIFESLKNK